MKLWISKKDYYELLWLVGKTKNEYYAAACKLSDDDFRHRRILDHCIRYNKLYQKLKKRGGLKNDIEK